MTDAPKTLQLNARQWRVLLHDHIEVLKSAVSQTESINEEALRNMYKHMDEMKMQATAWFQVSADGVSVPADAVDEPAKPKKGGWPLGKKRGGKSHQAVQ